MADLSTTSNVKSLRDAAHVAVGFGVLGFQRAQVRRRELTRQLRKDQPELWSVLEYMTTGFRKVCTRER